MQKSSIVFGDFREKITLPNNWKISTLEKLSTKIKAGGTPNTNEPTYYGGEIPFVSISDMTQENKYLESTAKTITRKGLENSSTWIVPKNSILLSMYATIGKPLINKMDLATHQGILGIIVDSKKMDIEFLFYSLNNIRKKLIRYFLTGTQANLNLGISKNLKIIHPVEIIEQQKIASILSNVDNLIELYDKVIESTKKLKKGMMQQLLTKGIGHTKFKQTKYGNIPDQWNVIKLGNILTEIRYGISKKSSRDGDGDPVIGISNIVNGKIDSSHVGYIQLTKNEKQNFSLRNGDILIVRTNANLNNLGRCTIFDDRDGTWLFASFLIRLRPDKEKTLPKFLTLFLNSEFSQNQILLIAKTSVGKYNINTEGIKSLPIFLPSLMEQQKIFTIISSVDSKIEQLDYDKSNLESLKKGLMQKLLTGQIRVKI